MTRRGNGFTLIELLTVLAVLSVISAIAFYSMRTFRQGYSVSNESRNLTIALQQTRMRALQNDEIAAVKKGSSSSLNFDAGTGYYSDVRFTTEPAHGFDTGDYVTFSGLTEYTGMNGGIFYITKVSDTQFDCPYYHKTNEAGVDTTTTPKARNLTKAAKLVIIQRPSKDVTDRTAAILTTCTKPNHFCYDGESVAIWDKALSWTPGSGIAAPSVTVGFDSRGFPCNQSGYVLGVAKSSATDTRNAVGIAISSFGNVKPASFGVTTP